jgi:hypothetical protein
MEKIPPTFEVPPTKAGAHHPASIRSIAPRDIRPVRTGDEETLVTKAQHEGNECDSIGFFV